MALNWTARVTALSALSLVGADASNRDAVVGRLNSAGPRYDAARTSLGAGAVDAAQATGNAALAVVLSATQSAHAAADRCARFILGGVPPLAPIPFLPDLSGQRPLLARMATASQMKASPLQEALGMHHAAVVNAYGRAVSVKFPTPYEGTIAPDLGTSVRGFEGQVLAPLLAVADELLAELHFP